MSEFDLTPDKRLQLAWMHYDLRSFSKASYVGLFPGLTDEIAAQDLNAAINSGALIDHGDRFAFTSTSS